MADHPLPEEVHTTPTGFPDLIASTAGRAGTNLGMWLDAARQARDGHRTDEAKALLHAARERFPDAAEPVHDLARLAEDARDWVSAENFWRAFAGHRPDVWWGSTHVANALRRQGHMARAEAVLQDALERFPSEASVFIEYARTAEARRDWPEAARRWAAIGERFPNLPDGLAGQARASREQGRDEQAHALLVTALEVFPTATGPLAELARLAEARRDWKAAERWWRIWTAFEPSVAWGYSGLSNALREQQRLPEAEAVLTAQLERFPNEPILYIEHARFAERLRNWSQAAERWRLMTSRFPQKIEGYVGQANALRETGQTEQARALLEQTVQRFPTETAPLHDLARLAEGRADWQRARQLWQTFLALEPNFWPAHTGLANAEGRLGQHQAFETAVDAILERFPDIPEPLADIVEQIARRGSDLPLRHLDRLEQLLGAHIERPSPSHRALSAYPLIAFARHDWSEYRRRLSFARQKMPDDYRLGVMLSEAEELVAGDETIQTAPPPGPPDAIPDQDMTWEFESLGGGRGPKGDRHGSGGCEFGLFQRRHGAEPLGLLRFATIEPQDLIRALDNQFAGIGDGDTTDMLAGGTPDWQVIEKNYNIHFGHTHLEQARIAREDAARMVRRKLVFLRRKLLEELAAGEKIFVYRLADEACPRDHIDALAQALGRYSNNRLLFVLHDETAPNPFVIDHATNHLIVARFNPRGMTDSLVNYDSWRSLCEHARGAFNAPLP